MRPLILFFLALFSVNRLYADTVVNAPFTDHMVVQRRMPVPVWGTTDPGQEVRLTFNGQVKTVKAGADGKWRVVLSPMKEAGPLAMTIAGGNTITLSDIYVGEVWQCAGQSNMDLTLNNTSQFGTRFTDTIKAANFPLLRFMNMRPSRTQVGGPWQVISPETAGGCSATGFFFGKELLKSVNCAVGLVVTAVGGTLIETWFDKATVAADPGMKTTKNIVAGSNFDKYVAPVVGYGIRGTVWIQGEQNTYDTVFTPKYGEQFKTLITGWRKAWGQGDFPFYFGQLSSERPNKPGIALDTLAFIPMVREGQREALSLPGTAMTVNFDLRAGGWHYPQKYDAGKRLSLPARALVYGEKVEYSGPVLKSAKVKGSAIVLTFDHADGGLMAKDGDLKGFVIAGSDGKWVAATAVINGKTVEVTGPGVTSPAQLRYAWADRPLGNLYNTSGLPASPFKTNAR